MHADAPHPLERRDAGVRGSGDLRIAAPSPGISGVGQQQDARMPLTLRAGAAFAQDGGEFFALWRAELDVMLFLWHRIHLYTDNISTR